MRILFVIKNYVYFYAIDLVIRELFQRGHQVRLLIDVDYVKTNYPDEALQNAIVDLPNLEVRPMSRRRYLRGFTRNIREILNYVNILNSEESRGRDVLKWRKYLHPLLRRHAGSPVVKRVLKNKTFQKFLRCLERKIPVDAKIREEIRKYDPDVVVLMPLLFPLSMETEYMRAAQSLGIPAVFALMSWDNISTKGVFHGQPDYSVVWNESLANELVRLHDFPRDRIYMTGAPRFEYLFKEVEKYILESDEFFRQAGADANKSYILYVCSTHLVDKDLNKVMDEEIIILDLARALEANPSTKDVNILVRPHPSNPSVGTSLLAQRQGNIFVFPLYGELPDTEQKRKRYYSSIYYATAVAGVNTTAFLESAALDKPCITIYSEKFSKTQELSHFHHLTKAEFLEAAYGTNEVVEIVANIRKGKDVRAKQRRAFVKNFIAPYDKPAPQVFADVLEEIAAKST